MCSFRKSICIWSLLLVIAELFNSLRHSDILLLIRKFQFVIHKYLTGNIDKGWKQTTCIYGGIFKYMIILLSKI